MTKSATAPSDKIPVIDFSRKNVVGWRLYDEDALEGMNPRYVAFVRAHGYRVPANRNDIFMHWLAPAWDVFLAEKGYEMPLKAQHPFNATEVRNFAILEHGEAFDVWILGVFPPDEDLQRRPKNALSLEP